MFRGTQGVAMKIKHDIAVLLVTSRDSFGRPQTARFVHDDQIVDLTEVTKELGETPYFITVLVDKKKWAKS